MAGALASDRAMWDSAPRWRRLDPLALRVPASGRGQFPVDAPAGYASGSLCSLIHWVVRTCRSALPRDFGLSPPAPWVTPLRDHPKNGT